MTVKIARIFRDIDLLKSIKLINIIFAFFLLALLYSFARELINPSLVFRHKKNLSSSQSTPVKTTRKSFKQEDNLAASLNSIRSKNLFKIYVPAVKTASVEPQAPKPTVSKPEDKIPKLNELAGKLSLNGIVSGKPMQAVILDSSIGRTYFVVEGDLIDNIKIKQVLKDRVILSYNGEEMGLQ